MSSGYQHTPYSRETDSRRNCLMHRNNVKTVRKIRTLDANRLFLNTIEDIEQRITATDEYTVLMSGALLRKLFLDQSRLIDQVNRVHKLKLRFNISDISPFEQLIYASNPEFWTIEDGLDPESPLAYAPFDATIDQFLHRRIMRSSGQWITVQDAIKQLANIDGAVHSGSAKNENELALQAAARFYSRAGLAGAMNQIKSIGRITVRGLIPLRDAVINTGTDEAKT